MLLIVIFISLIIIGIVLRVNNKQLEPLHTLGEVIWMLFIILLAILLIALPFIRYGFKTDVIAHQEMLNTVDDYRKSGDNIERVAVATTIIEQNSKIAWIQFLEKDWPFLFDIFIPDEYMVITPIRINE